MNSTVKMSPRAAITVQFAAFGLLIGFWAGSLPVVVRAVGIGPATFGLIITLHSAAYIIAMSLGAKLMERLSPRRIMLLVFPAFSFLLAAALVSQDATLFAVLLIAFGFVGGTIDLVMNTEGTLVEADMKRPILAALHGSASAGVAASAVVASLVALSFGTAVNAALIGVVCVAAFIAVSVGTPDRPLAHRPTGTKRPRLTIGASLLAIGIVMGISIAGETAALMWSATLLDEQAPALAGIAGLGSSFFAGCQAILRFGGDRLRRIFSDRRLVAISIVVAATGFTIVGTSGSFAQTVVGFAVIGLGTALISPCSMALAVATAPALGGAALSFAAFVAGGPRLGAPWIFGEIAAATSTAMAFGIFGVGFLVALAAATMIGRSNRSPGSVISATRSDPISLP